MKKGYIYSIASHIVWGILPLYWAVFKDISSLELLCFRILLTAITLIVIVHLIKKPVYLSYLKNPKIIKQLLLSGLLISINWFVFVYAVGSNQVLQASLGYYIGPLFTVLIGVLYLKEKPTKIQYLAFGLVGSALIYILLNNDTSWIAFGVAISFSLYGFLKKRYHLDSLNSLLLEALFVLPFMLIITWMTINQNGTALNEVPPLQWILIIFAGILTIIPLVLFAEGAKELPLYMVGIIQYITPTMFLLVGVLVNKEPFTTVEAIAFGLIWIALVLNFTTIYKKEKRNETIIKVGDQT